MGRKGPEKKLEGQMSFDDAVNLIRNTPADKISRRDLRRAGKVIFRDFDAQKRMQRNHEIVQQEAEKLAAQTVCMDLPMDWENAFCNDDRAVGVHAESIPDGLIMSLSNLGRVDIEYISAVTGADYKTVIETLRGSIFQNPETWEECFYKGWETSEEYLSGNLMRKLNVARRANDKFAGYFDSNIQAIQAVLPSAISTEDIYITLGSPWVPTDVIDQFIEDTFNTPKDVVTRYLYREVPSEPTRHDEVTGTWEIYAKGRYGYTVKTNRIFGTERINALHILEKTLNGQTPVIYDEVPCPTNKSGVRREINRSETALAIEKQQLQISEFQKWVWKDGARRERLMSIYENRFGCMRRRLFDGSFLTFPTMSPAVQLYPYQKNAVARILFSSNTLLAHDVGSGKTYVMIAAGQELRRMGLSKKNLYVVPNNIVGQWRDIFLTMYPEAKLLCVEPRNFTLRVRQKVLAEIRDGDYDGIIMAYSCFELIPLSKKYYTEDLQQQQEEISRLCNIDYLKSTSAIHRKEMRIEAQLSKLELKQEPAEIYFDDLGIDRLFVDEAHNFKNVPFDTKTEKVLGLNPTGSKKCQEMLDKVHQIQRTHDGKGVVFATGTPITNSVTDVYTMQRYLQGGELTMLELQSFDSWIGMFAEQATQFEIDVDTSTYRLATRFAKFHNLPELTALLGSFADFHQVDLSAGIPDHEGYEDALSPRSPAFRDYLQEISQRADDVRKHRVKPSEDNMLKITTDGRKAALDIRLVDEKQPFDPYSKAAVCAANVAEIYRKTTEQRSTQLIFCDTSVPKETFNLYDEMRRLLEEEGIPPCEIAYIHDAATEKGRERLFDRMRRGEVRILIGSTFKLGLGVNIQDRLIALHHLDVPWRPADMTQREGRILRQGNSNGQVWLYRYITEGSFDAYSWQLLETKQRFIAALLSGSLTQRSGSDVDDTVLSYAEVKALAVGNPLVKERVECANELSRYRMLQAKLTENRAQMEQEKMAIPAQEETLRKTLVACGEDAFWYEIWQQEHPLPKSTAEKQNMVERRRELREMLQTALQNYDDSGKEKTILTYRGFEVVLPANMLRSKPFVWLTRQGRYYAELGDDAIGNLVRIDHTLDALRHREQEMKNSLAKLQGKKAELETELAKKVSYGDEIARCETRLRELDEQLGVKL